jgi:hypothetical protein
MKTERLYKRLVAAQTRLLNRHQHPAGLRLSDALGARWRDWLWGFSKADFAGVPIGSVWTGGPAHHHWRVIAHLSGRRVQVENANRKGDSYIWALESITTTGMVRV